MSKDFASSHEQMLWKHAVAEHVRLQEYIIKYPYHRGMGQYARFRIEELEKMYPCLRSKAST